MARDSHIHHAIDYIELTVTDMAQAKRFYEAAFDWEFNDYGPGYAGVRKEGGEAGGLRLGPEVSAGGPLVILYSNDLDASVGRVREAGGRITEEPYEFPGGRRFHFRDPTVTSSRCGRRDRGGMRPREVVAAWVEAFNNEDADLLASY